MLLVVITWLQIHKLLMGMLAVVIKTKKIFDEDVP